MGKAIVRIRSLAALAACLALPILAAGQGLGGAAAKEKQRRAEPEKTSKPPKTYTEDDLKGLAPVENPGGSDSAGKSEAASKGTSRAASPDADASGDAEGRARAQDEQRWRARMADARARVEKARQRVTYFEGLNLVPGYEYLDDTGRPVITSVEQLQGLTRRAKAELAAAEKALDDLSEEARHASVPPGWLR